jgi:hypothetical protein
MGQLEWSTNGGKCVDDGKGTALRNWENTSRGTEDVVFMWGEQPFEAVKVHVFYAWRNFAVPRMDARGRAFDPDYLEALFENRTEQSKRLELDASEVAARAFVDPGTWGRPHQWWYAKLVGETEDGRLFDIRDWSLGSAAYRSGNELPAAPTSLSELKHVERPSGDKDLRTRWEPNGDRWAEGHEPAH